MYPSIPPTPPTTSPHKGDFSFLKRASSPSHPDYSSLNPTHNPLPNALPPHWLFIARLERSYFTFIAERDEWKSNNVGIPNFPKVYANSHRDFTLTNGFWILCSKKNGSEDW
ncbi:hypothetical protein AVEN_24497-1 [Araneus ventricosus]|uniref:Uncharacterized protein n=1 Tax=Araneus ventricosus TaxID=182803 RepID=A0A4Y2L0E0_ARAVE|nr:hypothetical protein AVEN_24497-1 [Araneus ventricosus]